MPPIRDDQCDIFARQRHDVQLTSEVVLETGSKTNFFEMEKVVSLDQLSKPAETGQSTDGEPRYFTGSGGYLLPTKFSIITCIQPDLSVDSE